MMKGRLLANKESFFQFTRTFQCTFYNILIYFLHFYCDNMKKKRGKY